MDSEEDLRNRIAEIISDHCQWVMVAEEDMLDEIMEAIQEE